MNRPHASCAALLLASLLTACSEAQRERTKHVVELQDAGQFQPGALTVKVGATVVWHNQSVQPFVVWHDPVTLQELRSLLRDLNVRPNLPALSASGQPGAPKPGRDSLPNPPAVPFTLPPGQGRSSDTGTRGESGPNEPFENFGNDPSRPSERVDEPLPFEQQASRTPQVRRDAVVIRVPRQASGEDLCTNLRSRTEIASEQATASGLNADKPSVPAGADAAGQTNRTFRSRVLYRGDTFRHTFTQAGEYLIFTLPPEAGTGQPGAGAYVWRGANGTCFSDQTPDGIPQSVIRVVNEP